MTNAPSEDSAQPAHTHCLINPPCAIYCKPGTQGIFMWTTMTLVRLILVFAARTSLCMFGCAPVNCILLDGI